MELSTEREEITPQVERRILSVGRELSQALKGMLEAIPSGPRGPVDLGKELGIDKVLASRLLKSVRSGDPLAMIHLAPGPEPLRRVIRGAGRCRVPTDLLARARAAVADFDQLIRQEAGDRSALQAMISAWLPEARREFELRRKQTVFRAMSQLKGSSTRTSLATVILHPAEDPQTLDVVWLFGMLGMQRHRPGVQVKFASRRIARDREPRRPLTLDRRAVEDLRGLRMDQFCTSPPPDLEVHEVGEVVRYLVGGKKYGPSSLVDLVFAEVNLSEIDRYVPAGCERKSYFFAEVTTPARRLLFDVLVHREVYPGSIPELVVYDTVSEGVASVNDRSRDLDRLELEESTRSLGIGVSRFHTATVPHYSEMLKEVCRRLGWDGGAFRGYRCAIDYPIYGSQVTMVFDPPVAPETA
jgi:hypothetical protein